jgi:hypothetical protein
LRARACIVAVALVGGGFPALAAAPAACASGSASAALVVDRGDRGGVVRLCVELDDTSVSGIELIELAGEQHGLDYRLGYGGQGVCMLAGVGPPEGDCFADYPDYWGYWRGSSRGWTWASAGAGSTQVQPGDVDGWSWGPGADGASHAPPAPTPPASVCAPATPSPSPTATASSGTETERARPRRRPRGAPTATPTAAAPSPAPAAEPAPEPSRSPKGIGGRLGRAMKRMPREVDAGRIDLAARPGGGDPERRGPPAAGIAGVAGAVVLGAAGALLARRRRLREGP